MEGKWMKWAYSVFCCFTMETRQDHRLSLHCASQLRASASAFLWVAIASRGLDRSPITAGDWRRALLCQDVATGCADNTFLRIYGPWGTSLNQGFRSTGAVKADFRMTDMTSGPEAASNCADSREDWPLACCLSAVIVGSEWGRHLCGAQLITSLTDV